jgi:uncharacterized protein (TIGR02266 family)
MEKGREKRRDPRVPLVLRVDYPGVQQTVRDATENVSAGGLFIRTERDLRPGDRVPLAVSFPGLLDPVQVEVEVVRRRPQLGDEPAGVAVKIPIDRVDDRHKLARLAETARAGLGRVRRSYRVLVVEDNPRVVEMYEYALRTLRSAERAVDVGVEYAANGDAALARLAEPPKIELVVADLHLPIMDGLTLVERMRAVPAFSRTPIVVISAGGVETRARAEALGVDVYLQKPVQLTDVIGTVRTLLEVEA